jgi:hypothetical protein
MTMSPPALARLRRAYDLVWISLVRLQIRGILLTNLFNLHDPLSPRPGSPRTSGSGDPGRGVEPHYRSVPLTLRASSEELNRLISLWFMDRGGEVARGPIPGLQGVPSWSCRGCHSRWCARSPSNTVSTARPSTGTSVGGHDVAWEGLRLPCRAGAGGCSGFGQKSRPKGHGHAPGSSRGAKSLAQDQGR